MVEKINFGFEKVALNDKEPLVQEVFTTVASKYDLMNNLMSMGIHKIWKDKLINEISPVYDETLLDVAGGTGDISQKFLNKGGYSATVADLNPAMLNIGKAKLLDPRITWIEANAQSLPFNDNSFDYYTIAFGLRNITDIKKALSEAFRVLKPMGKFLCLEFSQVTNPIIKKFYDAYSFKLIPKIGKVITGDEKAYKYLIESIRNFESAPRLTRLLQLSGFENVHYYKLSFGIVAIHIGYKV